VTPADVRRAYIRQSVHSDYCGEYACAAFLTLLGRVTTRDDARALFRMAPRRATGGISHGAIVAVLRQLLPFRTLFWHRTLGVSPTRSGQLLLDRLRRTPLPTILTYTAKHRRRPISCVHAVVVVAVGKRIALLDSLALPPTRRALGNATLVPVPNRAGLFEIAGSFYRVDLTARTHLLWWRLPGD
jgi:hypothetical protein